MAPTLAAAGAALAAAKATKAKAWLHVQDFEVDAAFDLGLLSSGAARRLALGMERWLLRRFDRVSSIAPAMVSLLRTKGVAAEQTIELRNWVDLDAFPTWVSSDTAYRAQLGIAADQIVALYSGNMAGKQGIEALADVAARLKAVDAPVTLLLCGEGPARATLETACQGLANVKFLPLQPLERLPELLATADIHLLPQRPEAADLVLPSKLTGMLASGRPGRRHGDPGHGSGRRGRGLRPGGRAGCGFHDARVLALAADADLRRTLGGAGKARARSRWRKRAIIDGFVNEVARTVKLADTSVASSDPARHSGCSPVSAIRPASEDGRARSCSFGGWCRPLYSAPRRSSCTAGATGCCACSERRSARA